MSDQRTREYLQGYGSAVADLYRIGYPRLCLMLLEGVGLTYHDLKDAGLDTQDLGAIAKARVAASPGPKRPVRAR